jgi:hypothetical protein
MTKANGKASGEPKVLEVKVPRDQTEAQAMAWVAVNPETNAAVVIDAFQSNIVGSDVNLMALVDALRKSTDQSKAGDLSDLEAMLISQATALQAIFASFARRAVSQQYQKNLEAFMGMALKAQAQSRATISALVDLKYPRQATFVKQANIANGPQQVNYGTRAGDIETQQNELLEDASHERLDTGTTPAATRGNPAVETMAAIHRPKKPRRQGQSGA